jgi:DNA-binding transcriptional ArsR family regulator
MVTSNLLSTIQGEIEARIADLRPLLDEYEQLLTAMQALDAQDGPVQTGAQRSSGAAMRGGRPASASGAAKRASAAGAIKRAASGPGASRSPRRRATVQRAGKPRAGRGAAREAILAALEHGSHTVGELVTVTAMSTANISGNVRKLLAEGAVSKTERDGKAAYVLAAGPHR